MIDDTPVQETPHHAPQPVQAPHSAPVIKINAIDIVWQFLCYSLWELTLLTVTGLLSTTLTYFFIAKTHDYSFAIYVFAVLICLLPVALVAEKFYAKREVMQKHGFSAVVMVLNAVGVFLVTLGSLITIVVTLLVKLVNGNISKTDSIVIMTAFIVLVLGAMLFARIINQPKLARVRRIFPTAVVAIAVITLILTIVGPIHYQTQTKADRMIDDGLPAINSALENYATGNNKLPSSLSALSSDSSASYSLDPAAKQLISKNLVSYERRGVTGDSSDYNQVFAFQLCVTYTKPEGMPRSGELSETDLDSVNHPAGYVCYLLHSDGS